MGAWGLGPFENDSSCDWLFDLEQAADYTFITDAFNAVLVIRAGADVAPPNEEALGAAEVVAASRGRAMADLPEEIQTWVAKIGPAPQEVVSLALQTVAAIKAKSELRDRWEEANSLAEWTATLDDLESRLKA